MHRFAILALSTAAMIVPQLASATGRYTCEATERANWLSEADLTTQLEASGWSVRRMKEDGGCWEVYGTDPEGRRVEGYFHPVTGAAQLVSQRGTILFDVRKDG